MKPVKLYEYYLYAHMQDEKLKIQSPVYFIRSGDLNVSFTHRNIIGICNNYFFIYRIATFLSHNKNLLKMKNP